MTRRRYFAIVLLLLVGSISASAQVPAKLSDQEFWKISSEFSEADGTFRSDNLLSNEEFFQYALPDLTQVAKPGRVYMGVGPEQNFTYIAALKPTMALIIDIRRGNLDLQLMYKALFELSKDRAEFVSRLFARQRPDGLDSKSTAREIFAAYAKVEPSEKLYNDNLDAIRDVLVSKHGFPLLTKDLEGIKYVYDSFRAFGPDINYSSTSGGFGGRVTYAELMTATDESGEPRSYLASEENFTILKDLEAKNLVVPFVGDFAGPKAIRSIGKYLKETGYHCVGILLVERRTVPASRWHLAKLLWERRKPADRCNEHLHSNRTRRPLWAALWRFRTDQRFGKYDRGFETLCREQPKLTPIMIIDCHGHYTTAPKELQTYRDGQIAGLKDPSHVPSKGTLNISDDQIRESLEGAQLKFQRERGTDVTIFSPRASAMGHHIGNGTTSLHWTAALQ